MLRFVQEALLRQQREYTYNAHAATHVAVWRLERTALFALLDDYPRMRCVSILVTHAQLTYMETASVCAHARRCGDPEVEAPLVRLC
jgi:CRP-like cAMP-binding protein